MESSEASISSVEIEVLVEAESGKVAESAPDPAPLSLQEQRDELDSEIAELDRQLNGLRRERDSLMEARDSIQIAIEQSRTPNDNQLGIQAAIQRSNEIRAQRAARVQELLGRGVEPNELAPIHVSPLDSAISSKLKNKHPHRPQYAKVR